MKPQIALTPDQMHELQSLGLDCSDASMAWVVYTDEHYTILEVSKSANLDYVEKYSPAYTLEDIICKTNADMLYRPTNDGTMEWRCQVYGSDGDDFNYFNGIGNTPLDAAFVMLKYAIKEHPDKIRRL